MSRVRAYKNLNRRVPGTPYHYFSIQEKVNGAWRVTNYMSTVTLTNVTMTVRAAAQQKVQSGGARSVHAWVEGELSMNVIDTGRQICYRPHERGEFFLADTGTTLTHCTAVVCRQGRMYLGEVKS